MFVTLCFVWTTTQKKGRDSHNNSSHLIIPTNPTSSCHWQLFTEKIQRSTCYFTLLLLLLIAYCNFLLAFITLIYNNGKFLCDIVFVVMVDQLLDVTVMVTCSVIVVSGAIIIISTSYVLLLRLIGFQYSIGRRRKEEREGSRGGHNS